MSIALLTSVTSDAGRVSSIPLAEDAAIAIVLTNSTVLYQAALGNELYVRKCTR